MVGEVVFNTSLTGYQEILSDPSYAGQLVCLTMPEIGNVGVNRLDNESEGLGAMGLLCRSVSPVVSSWRAEASLDAYLRQRDIPGLAEFDTRALTKHLRELGSVGAAVSTEAKSDEELIELARSAPEMDGADWASKVSCDAPYTWNEPGWSLTERETPQVRFKVVALDFGIKRNILRKLRDVGIETTVLPASSSAADILARDPDGLLLSNGPGDPKAVEGAVQTIREVLDGAPKLPVFGICLGHQLLSLALGGKTFKLKFGHHGGNHPVRDERTGKVAITAQNHGFAIDPGSLDGGGRLTHQNLFDKTAAGVALADRPVTAVQYHPEASPGPHDSFGLFETFAEQIAAYRR